jgi:hypothetical protein
MKIGLCALLGATMFACGADPGSSDPGTEPEAIDHVEQAASRGGCRGSAFASCISYSGGSVVADFYYNGSVGDPGYAYAAIEIIKSDSVSGTQSYWSPVYWVNHNGHYDPYRKSVITAPPSHGSAINRLHVYTSSGSQHYYQDSPRVYFP